MEMWFWWFMFVCNLAYSLTMILAGRYMWKHAPKEISSVCGYRSDWSKINRDTWTFAQENCGRRWWKIGWIMLFPTILVQIPFYGKSDGAVGWLGMVICVVECGILIGSVPQTEKALKNTFNREGSRKDGKKTDESGRIVE